MRIQIRRTKGKTREPNGRANCQAYGLAPANGPDFIIFENRLQEGLCGLMERVLFKPKKINGKMVFDTDGFPILEDPPKPVPKVWDDHNYYSKQIVELVGICTVLSNEEVVDSRPPDKKKVYQEALDYFNKIKPLYKDCYKLTHEDAWPDGFVKAEWMELKYLLGMLTSCPRIISASRTVYNLRLARFITAIEKKIYSAINRIWDPTGRTKVVQKGYNGEEQAWNIVKAWRDVEEGVADFRLINQGDDNVIILKCFVDGKLTTRAVTIDAERFDQHVHIDTVKFEHLLYKKIFKFDTEFNELCQLLAWQQSYNIRGRFRDDEGNPYKLLVKGCKGRRRSGDMNTSLGNIYIATALLHGKLEFYKPMDLADFKHSLMGFCLTHGFVCKVEGEASTIDGIEFCRSHPFYNGSRWKMVPSIKSLTKYTMYKCPTKDIDERMSMIGIAGRLAFSDVPLYGEFFNQFPDKRVKKSSWNNNRWRDSGISYLTGVGRGDINRISKATGPVTEAGRISMFEGQGLVPSHQIAYEQDVKRIVKGTTRTQNAMWCVPFYGIRKPRVYNTLLAQYRSPWGSRC